VFPALLFAYRAIAKTLEIVSPVWSRGDRRVLPETVLHQFALPW